MKVRVAYMTEDELNTAKEQAKRIFNLKGGVDSETKKKLDEFKEEKRQKDISRTKKLRRRQKEYRKYQDSRREGRCITSRKYKDLNGKRKYCLAIDRQNVKIYEIFDTLDEAVARRDEIDKKFELFKPWKQ